METSDFVVIGGGVIGLCVALRLKKLYADASIVLLEKESTTGTHASGRNSGVLHAGFYYSPDSLKARMTREGAARMRRYCGEKRLPVNTCGKLVVARGEEDLSGLQMLLERGRANGVELQELTRSDAQKIEPRVKTFQKALFSPTTATVDPVGVMSALLGDAIAAGVDVRTGVRFLHHRGGVLTTSRTTFDAGYVVNAAGLHADKIAQHFGFARGLTMVGFKGLYLYSKEAPGSLRTNIYPVPDLKNPFLGVHLTCTASGQIKIGPTAIPCLWREQYGWIEGFHALEAARTIKTLGDLLVCNGFGFRSLAAEEIRKYRKRYLVSKAAELAEGVCGTDFERWGRPGIRAQLLDVREKKLVMDFCVQGDDRSFHILNAVSPAFTCAFTFAEYACEQISGKLR